MNILMQIVVHTANILGSFDDPFEFEGDYGAEVNSVRQTVFELVVAKEAYSDLPKDQAIQEDSLHGPLLSELMPYDLIEALTVKQQELGDNLFGTQELLQFSAFVSKYGDQKVFRFLRHCPSSLLSLDKILRDKASREGKSMPLPILSSKTPLTGSTSSELKINLLDALFTRETLALTKPMKTIVADIMATDAQALKDYLGPDASVEDLYLFASPAGQTLFYWMYQSLDLHLISTDQAMVQQINAVKETFAATLGDPAARAAAFREKLVAADSGVLFTQESDSRVPQALLSDGLFLPVDRQNPSDGTLVFLRSDLWEPDYEVIAVDDYEGYAKGRLSIILATHKETGYRFLLASGHGNSTRAEDGRLQIDIIMKKFHDLSRLPENAGLQLIIGIDANSKTEHDVRLLRNQLEALGLVATDVGPTTVKRRMVTAQHSKAGRAAIDEEDFLITLKPEYGGRFALVQPTVGFSEAAPDLDRTLPDVENPSDHYSVGAVLRVIE